MSRPRVGFLGVGWIGRNRLSAIARTGAVDIVGISDPSDEMATAALAIASDAGRVDSLDALLGMNLDGIVVATPSALHAGQSIRALESGVAVFCQKPLGRSAAEAAAVVAAARAVDRLLAVDLSYRFTDAMVKIADLVGSGALGRVFAVDLVFHNAYGPDKPWFYDREASGGGCLMDLGIHLVDLALWTLGFPAVDSVTGALFTGGERLRDRDVQVEDYAEAMVALDTGATVRLACSWRLHAGRDAVISAAFHGTEGGADMHNVNGSFHDFMAYRSLGTRREPLSQPPDEWGGRAAADWAARLAAGARFDPAVERIVDVATLLDRIYDCAGPAGLSVPIDGPGCRRGYGPI